MNLTQLGVVGQARNAPSNVPMIHERIVVVVSRAIVHGKTWPAAVNVGPNPTFGEDARKVEAHLIGFAGNLYEQSLSVDFIAKIRDTRPFRGVQELVEQIQRDIADVKRILDDY